MQSPVISVVVTCYNKRGTIADCVKSMLNQSLDRYELIVVDDGSTDGSDLILDQFLNNGEVTVVKESHRGVSAAKNLGIHRSRGRIILFLDGDCVLNHDSLSKLLASFDDRGCEAGCVGGELRALNEDNAIAKTVELIQNTADRKWPFGANVAYSRKAISQAGGFDELMENGEDAELFLRVKKLGFKWVVNPAVSAKTLNPDSVPRFLKQRFRWGMGYAQLTERHGETFTSGVKLCFGLTALLLFSPLLVLLDVRLIFMFVAALAWNVFRRVPLAVRTAKRTGDNRHSSIIPFLQLLNAVAYFFGWATWKILELTHKRRKLEGFTVEGAPRTAVKH